MRVLYPAALALAALARSASAAVMTVEAVKFSVICWRTEAVAGKLTIKTGPAYDNGCPVNVEITDLSGTFLPGDDVPVIWNVALITGAENANDIEMPVPPLPTLPAGAQDPVQIAATYTRTCESINSCDPTTPATLSTEFQSSNFSTTDDPLVFKALTGLKFDTPGDYVVAAFVDIPDAEAPTVAYHYATYSTITVSDTVAPKTTQNEGKVRCRTSRESALNKTLDASTNVADGEVCEVRVAMDPIQVAKPRAAVDVSWTATLDQNVDANIRMPSPLIQTDVDGKSYDIVSATLKVCKSSEACDEYTADADFEAVVSAGPASFSDNMASFTAKGVVLPTAGPHLAMIQFVIGGQNRRYDYMYYLSLVASDTDIAAAVDTATVTVDSSTPQCWSVLADGAQDNVASTSVAAVGQGKACPYTASLSVSAVTLDEADKLDLSWTVAANEAAATSSLPSGNLTASYDAKSNSLVTLPGLYLYACSEGTVCTPFNPNKTLIFTAPARNLTDGKAIVNAEGVKFPGPGKFTLMAHSVVPSGAGRVDIAVYAAVTVSGTESGSSNTLLYVLVSVGSVIGVIIIFLVVVWIRKRRHRQRMDKMVQFGLFGAPAARAREATMMKATESRSSVPSEHTAPSFNYVQPERSPAEYPAYINEQRKDSLSYDPYTRTSFMEMSVEESNLSFAFTDNNFSVDDSSLSFAFSENERRSSDSEAYDV